MKKIIILFMVTQALNSSAVCYRLFSTNSNLDGVETVVRESYTDEVGNITYLTSFSGEGNNSCTISYNTGLYSPRPRVANNSGDGNGVFDDFTGLDNDFIGFLGHNYHYTFDDGTTSTVNGAAINNALINNILINGNNSGTMVMNNELIVTFELSLNSDGTIEYTVNINPF